MLTFDRDTHTYKADGVKCPSVTQILKENGFSKMHFIDERILERASEFGSNYHLLTELYDNAELDLNTVDQAFWPMLEAWDNFLSDYGVEIERVEHQGYSMKHFFAFTIDRILRITKGPKPKWIGRRAILDLKTGAIGPSVDLQQGGYLIGWNDTHPAEKADLRLVFKVNQDGKWNVTECVNQMDMSVFLSCVNICHYKKLKGV